MHGVLLIGIHGSRAWNVSQRERDPALIRLVVSEVAAQPTHFGSMSSLDRVNRQRGLQHVLVRHQRRRLALVRADTSVLECLRDSQERRIVGKDIGKWTSAASATCSVVERRLWTCRSAKRRTQIFHMHTFVRLNRGKNRAIGRRNQSRGRKATIVELKLEIFESECEVQHAGDCRWQATALAEGGCR